MEGKEEELLKLKAQIADLFILLGKYEAAFKGTQQQLATLLNELKKLDGN